VRLAAVMNLVLEQMQQQPITAFDLRAGAAADLNIGFERLAGQAVADRDQPCVDRGLRWQQIGDGDAWRLVLERAIAQCSAFKGVDVEVIDNQNVIERPLQAWKEPSARQAVSSRWFAQALL
jgi:hypothetical protein